MWKVVNTAGAGVFSHSDKSTDGITRFSKNINKTIIGLTRSTTYSIFSNEFSLEYSKLPPAVYAINLAHCYSVLFLFLLSCLVFVK